MRTAAVGRGDGLTGVWGMWEGWGCYLAVTVGDGDGVVGVAVGC